MSTVQWVMFFSFSLFLGIPAWMKGQPVNPNSLLGFNFIFFFPSMIVVQQWYQQQPMWAMELLRPIQRSRYLQESGLTLAVWTAAAWAAFTIGWIIAALLFVPNMEWLKLATVLLAMSAIQVLLFAVGVWVMRFRAAALGVVTIGIAFGIASIIASRFTIFSAAAADTGAAFVFAIVTVLVSLAIIYDAYRHWLNTELG
jgi:hypothetical protein